MPYDPGIKSDWSALFAGMQRSADKAKNALILNDQMKQLGDQGQADSFFLLGGNLLNKFGMGNSTADPESRMEFLKSL